MHVTEAQGRDLGMGCLESKQCQAAMASSGPSVVMEAVKQQQIGCSRNG